MTGEALLLDLLLLPGRSLTPAQARKLILAFGLVCALGAMRFLALGFWPVACFLLLDVAALGLAFWLNFRAARGFEEIRLQPSRLAVRQVSAKGTIRQRDFNPYWVRVELETADGDEKRLLIRSHGMAMVLGRFLNSCEKKEVADLITSALARLRTGERIRTPS